MRTVRFHEYGEPADVLRLETAPVPEPGPGPHPRRRARLRARARRLGSVPGPVRRTVAPRHRVRRLGHRRGRRRGRHGRRGRRPRCSAPPTSPASPAPGAADRAIMDHWFAVPEGLDLIQAAALPMALSTAYWHLARLGLSADSTILINGAGTTIGYAAVQIALIRGMRVIATAGRHLRPAAARPRRHGDRLRRRPGRPGQGHHQPPGRHRLRHRTAQAARCRTSSRSPAATPERVLTCSDLCRAAARRTRHLPRRPRDLDR